MSSHKERIISFINNELIAKYYPYAKQKFKLFAEQFKSYFKKSKKFRIAVITASIIAIYALGTSLFGSRNSIDENARFPMFENIKKEKIGTGLDDIDFGMSHSDVAEILGKDTLILNEEFSDSNHNVYASVDDRVWLVFKNDSLVYTKRIIPYRGELRNIIGPHLEKYGDISGALNLTNNSLSKAPFGGLFERRYSDIVNINFEDANIMIEASEIQTNSQKITRLIISHAEITEFNEQLGKYISEIGIPVADWLENIIGDINNDGTYTKTPGEFKGNSPEYFPWIVIPIARNYTRDEDGNLIADEVDQKTDVSVWNYLKADDYPEIIRFERSDTSNYGMKISGIRRVKINNAALMNRLLPKYLAITHIGWITPIVDSELIGKMFKKIGVSEEFINKRPYNEKIGMEMNLEECDPYAKFIFKDEYQLMILTTGEIYITGV